MLFRSVIMNVKNVNYQIELDRILQQLPDTTHRLLLHSCCAPCSSYVIEYLSSYFKITVFYYNPNITEQEEYFKRVEEQKRLIREMPLSGKVDFLEGKYDPESFYEMAKGLERCPEGGERCFACYELRLKETARIAQELQADYFTTTLTISPLKNAAVLNEIGQRLACIYRVPFLPSDFKKKNGYKRSIELSHEYELYRQNYCGCCYSKAEALQRQAAE